MCACVYGALLCVRMWCVPVGCGMWVCVVLVCRGVGSVFRWDTRYIRKFPVVGF